MLMNCHQPHQQLIITSVILLLLIVLGVNTTINNDEPIITPLPLQITTPLRTSTTIRTTPRTTIRSTPRSQSTTTRPGNCPPCPRCNGTAEASAQRTNSVLVGVALLLGLGVVTLLGVQMYSKLNHKTPKFGQSEENLDSSGYRTRSGRRGPQSTQPRMNVVRMARPVQQEYVPAALQPSTRRSSSSFNTIYMDPTANNPSGFESSEMPQGTEVPIRKATPPRGVVKIIPGSPGVTGMVIAPGQPIPPSKRNSNGQN